MKPIKVILPVLIFLLLAQCAAAATRDVGPGYTYTTIAAGVAAANSGDSVHIHAGTYILTSPVNLKSGITVYGDGYSNTIIRVTDKSLFNSDAASAMFQLSGINNVNIYGLKFQGPATSTADIHDSSQTYYGGHGEYHNAIRMNGCSGVSIHDCYFTLLLNDCCRAKSCSGCSFYNNQCNTPGHDAIQGFGLKNWQIYNNYVAVNINCGFRIADSPSCGTTISYNTFTNGYANSGWTAVQIQGSTTGLIITKNVFTQMTDNYGVASYSSSASGCTISNNAYYSVPSGFINGCSGATISGNTGYGSEQNWASLGVGWTAGNTSGGGTAPPTAVYNGSSATLTLVSPSAGSTATIVNGKVTFVWSDVNSTNYNILVSNDTNFNIIIQNITTTSTSTKATLDANTTYYWKARAWNDVNRAWAEYTGSASFTTTTASESTTSNYGVYGTVTDSTTGNPISGATILLLNDASSYTTTTTADGSYSFSMYGNGTYYISATATGYTSSSSQPITLADSTEVNFQLSPSQSYQNPHYVTFTVSNIWGTTYSGVLASVYDGANTSSLATTQSATDDHGRVVFELKPDQTYTITFVDSEQNINTQRTYMPSEDSYRVIVWNANKKAATTDNNSEVVKKLISDIIVYRVSHSDYNMTAGYINQTIGVTNGSSNITSWLTSVQSVYWNGTADGNYTYAASGNSSTNISIIVPTNATYLVTTTITQPDIGGIITKTNRIELKGYTINPAFDFGWDQQWHYEAMGYVLLLLTGGLFGQRNKLTGMLCVLGVGLFLCYIGWFQYDLTGNIMIYVAVLLVIAYIFGRRD